LEKRLDARLRDLSPRGVHNVLATVAAIDEFKGWWHGRVVPDAPVLKRLSSRAVRISATASLQIGGRIAPAPPRGPWRSEDSLIHQAQNAAHIQGYTETLRMVLDGYSNLPFGEGLIQRLHAGVLKYSDQDAAHRGQYKAVPDPSPSFLRRAIDPPALRASDPDLTPRAMAIATGWASTRLDGSEFHPLLVIGSFILELMAIRPFVNGNGRVARILGTYLLLRSGYAFVPYASREKVIAERWTDYYFALRQSQASTALPRPDITPWLSVFLSVIRTQARELRLLFEEQPDASRLSPTQLGVLRLLERDGEVTNRLISSELKIPRETAKQVLNRLLVLNFVRRMGTGRAVRYRRALRQRDGGVAR